MSIRLKIISGFAVLILILVLFGAAIYLNVSAIEGDVAALQDVFEGSVRYDSTSLDETVNVKSQLNDYQSAVKDYLNGKTTATGDIDQAASDLDSIYQQLKANITQATAKVRSGLTAPARRADQATLANFEKEYGQLQKDVAQGRMLVQSGQGQAAATLYSQKIKSDFNTFHDDVVRFQRALESRATNNLAQYEQVASSTQASIGQLNGIVGGALAAAVALALVASFMISLRIARPITVIGKAARAVEQGNFKKELLTDLTRSRDELGELARVFQSMAEQVAARVESLRSQIDQLHIQIDEHQRQRDVAAVTESPEFRDLATKAAALRKQREESKT